MIWQYCPKEIYVSRSTVTDAANFAVAVFNDGNEAFLKLFDYLGVKGGRYAQKRIQNTDTVRLYYAKRKSSDYYKKARKQRRAERQGFKDKKAEEEGNVYEPGSH